MANIGLFGGSFDPVHNAHVNIVKHLIDSSIIDNIIVIPSFSPPHKANRTVASFHHRAEMLKIAFQGINAAVVDTVEKDLSIPGYSINTIIHFKKKYPSDNLFWIMGTDSLIEFPTWYKPKEILENCKIIVVKRPGTTITNVPDWVLKKCVVTDFSEMNVSSTYTRGLLKNSLDLKGILPDHVIEYIKKEKLYINADVTP